MVARISPSDMKQTDIGPVPSDWEVKRIHDFTDCAAGGTPSTYIKDFWGGSIRWMNSGELNNKIVNDVEGRITEAGMKNSSTRLFPKKCVLIGLAGQGKTRGTAAINTVELCTNQSIAAIFPNSNFDSKFLYHSLDSRYHQLRSLSTGDSGRGGLNLTIIRNVNLPIPTLEEQKQIAEVLSGTDDLIESLKRLINKKKDIKKAIMQELLTAKKRLPNFNKEWEIKKIGDCLEIRHGKSQKQIEESNGVNPILATGGEIGRTNSFLSKNPSVLIGRKGTINKPQYVEKPFWTVDTLFYSDIKQNSFPKFIFYKFCMINWMKYNEASGVPSLNAKTIENVEIKIPNKMEQKEIVNILSDIDLEIEALEKKLAKVQMLKSGMLQELLTGRTRLLKTEKNEKVAA